MLPEFFEFYNPTKVVYEAGVATDLKPELDIIGIQKYFIVSDHILDEIGLVQKVADGLTEAGFEVTGKFLDVAQDARLKDAPKTSNPPEPKESFPSAEAASSIRPRPPISFSRKAATWWRIIPGHTP